MQIQLLGGFAVRLGPQALPPGTPKQQTVLAMLACNAGQLVSVEQLVDELWSDNPPPSAIPNVRTYAANLRRGLEAMFPDRDVLIRARNGYRLEVECSDVDLCAFRAEVIEARRLLSADEHEAVRLVSRALARWRGPMLAGTALGPGLSAQVAAATEDRLLATELYGELQVRLGHYDEALPVLRELLTMHPLREPAHLLLMRALHLGETRRCRGGVHRSSSNPAGTTERRARGGTATVVSKYQSAGRPVSPVRSNRSAG